MLRTPCRFPSNPSLVFVRMLSVLFFTLACVPTAARAMPPAVDPLLSASDVTFPGPLAGATAVGAGFYHTCALTAAGAVQCWGSHLWETTVHPGGTVNMTEPGPATPTDVSGITGSLTAITTGATHSCALTAAGGVKCWGYDTYGALGDGAEISEDPYLAVDVVGLTSGVTAISAGFYHTCALTTGGSVKCWGGNSSGQLGDGTITNRASPVDVVGLTSGVSAISAGFYHTCALTAGKVKCWGYGHSVEPGVPIDIRVSEVAAISAGAGQTCVLTTSGGVKCWDKNNGPLDVVGLTTGVIAVSAGPGHTCALTDEGGVLCWGSNTHSQLGIGRTADDIYPRFSTIPAPVVGLTQGIAAISAGGFHTCALTAEGGRVKCWGFNGYGQLGDFTYLDHPLPMDVLVQTTCLPLTLTHTGNGADPVAAPTASPGCPAGDYLPGEPLVVTAAPDPDHVVHNWMGTSGGTQHAAFNTLAMPTHAHTVTVTYEPCFPLTAQTAGKGESLVISPIASLGCAPGRYVSGQSIVLSAAPASGWTIANWSGTDDDDATAATNTLTMPSAATTVSITYIEGQTGSVLHLPLISK